MDSERNCKKEQEEGKCNSCRCHSMRTVHYELPAGTNVPAGFAPTMLTKATSFKELRAELHKRPLVPGSFVLYLKREGQWVPAYELGEVLPTEPAVLELKLLRGEEPVVPWSGGEFFFFIGVIILIFVFAYSAGQHSGCTGGETVCKKAGLS